MKNYKLFQLLIGFTILASVPPSAGARSDPLIFGGPGHKQFLGCLVCNEFSSESISNGFGPYGNEFSSKGTLNEFSKFGNDFNSSRPWNEFSTSNSDPVLVDKEGKLYGYVTINDSRPDAVKFTTDLKAIFKSERGDFEKIRVRLCNRLGYGS